MSVDTTQVSYFSVQQMNQLHVCGRARQDKYLNILLVNHLDICGCFKQVQYLSIRVGPLLDAVHRICPKSTNTLEITEVPIGMDGLQADSHTHTEPCGEEA